MDFCLKFENLRHCEGTDALTFIDSHRFILHIINNYADIVNELKDALINVKTNEYIKECEICELFDKECEISQTLEPFHNFYTIRINNIWECDSVLKIL